MIEMIQILILIVIVGLVLYFLYSRMKTNTKIESNRKCSCTKCNRTFYMCECDLKNLEELENEENGDHCE